MKKTRLLRFWDSFSNVCCIRWCLSGNIIISGHQNGQINIWNGFTGVNINNFKAHTI